MMNTEAIVRIAAFAGIFLAMAGWEVIAPRRDRAETRRSRWVANLGMVALDTILLRVTVGAPAVAVAAVADEGGWGLFGRISIPYWAEFILTILILDFAVWVQHVLTHVVPLFWRFHRVHHTDLDVDTTTGVRFHPVEIIGSMLYKTGVVAAVGAPPWAVLAFEVILNGTALFNHGNVRMPRGPDRMIRSVFVTPDMHRVHHSILPKETNSNFGFALSWWDRLLGTYRPEPAGGHTAMTLGVQGYREQRELGLGRLLVQPFRKAPPAGSAGHVALDPSDHPDKTD